MDIRDEDFRVRCLSYFRVVDGSNCGVGRVCNAGWRRAPMGLRAQSNFSLNPMNCGLPLLNRLLIPKRGTGDMRPTRVLTGSVMSESGMIPHGRGKNCLAVIV
jgi:hypothetical protein